MRVFYCCYGQAHSSVTAANIHLGRLPRHRRASLKEILAQPHFDRAEESDLGTPLLMGREGSGVEVYVVGLASGRRAMVRAVEGFLEAQGVAPGLFLFVDAVQHAGLLLRAGGYASRRLGLVFPGRPLAALGVWLRYPRFVRLVEDALGRLNQPPP